ncbi:NAD(P)/FAD-dependent oxidoreductase, partial [Streptomyces sp. 2MCAF27]
SDKEAGPELDLALFSQRVWREDLAEHAGLWEFEAKGGLVVAATPGGADALAKLVVEQRAQGIEAVDVPQDELPDYEPQLSPELVSGAFYPQDAQVQPMLVVAQLLRMARQAGARVRTDTEVTGFLRTGDRITGVRTSRGPLSAPAVLNAAGTWGGAVAELAGVRVPVLPRRGCVLVTQPLPVMV